MWGNLLEVTIHTWCVPKRSRQWSENIVSRFCAALKSLAIVRQDLVLKTVKVMSIESHHDVSPLPSRSIACRLRQRTWINPILFITVAKWPNQPESTHFFLLWANLWSWGEGDEYWVPSQRVAFTIAVDCLPSEAEKFKPGLLVSLCVVRITMYDHCWMFNKT